MSQGPGVKAEEDDDLGRVEGKGQRTLTTLTRDWSFNIGARDANDRTPKVWICSGCQWEALWKQGQKVSEAEA